MSTLQFIFVLFCFSLGCALIGIIVTQVPFGIFIILGLYWWLVRYNSRPYNRK
jgi:hypothetical protein